MQAPIYHIHELSLVKYDFYSFVLSSLCKIYHSCCRLIYIPSFFEFIVVFDFIAYMLFLFISCLKPDSNVLVFLCTRILASFEIFGKEGVHILL